MIKIKVQKIGQGLHPSEIVVMVNTSEGSQRLVISDRSLDQNGYMSVGYPIRKDGDLLMVELPRETMSGSSRVWVDAGLVSEEEERKHA